MKNLMAMITVAVLFLTGLGTGAGAEGLLCGPTLGKSQVLQIQVKEQAISMEETGSRNSQNVVIFLSGLERDRSQFTKVEQQMRRTWNDFISIRIDLLGQGQTARTMGPQTSIQPEDQETILESVLARPELQGKHIILVGHSYGGGIAAKFAADHPNVVSDLILIAPFVDNLEIHQPLVGPSMDWMRYWAKFMQMGSVYDSAVQGTSEMGSVLTWPTYKLMQGIDANLMDVLAMTRGIRHLDMNAAVANLQNIRVHMLISSLDELIPTPAHKALWELVPEPSRGTFQFMPSTHNSVTYHPAMVSEQILRILRGLVI